MKYIKKIIVSILIGGLGFLTPLLASATSTIPWITTDGVGIYPNTINGSSPFVGVGTTSPYAKFSVSTASQQSGLLPLFEVASSTNAALFNILGNGNVGINVSNPKDLFDVGGNIVMSKNGGIYYFSGTTYNLIGTATGTENYFLGGAIPPSITMTGAHNISIGGGGGGAGAGGNLTSGDNNVFVGSFSGNVSTSANFDTFMGSNSGAKNTTGSSNTFIGREAGFSNITAPAITAVGYLSLSNTTAASSTALGYQSGVTNTAGTLNTFLGYNADASSVILTNATAIGANAIVGASNSLVLGGMGANAVNVGIGTTSPASTLTTIGSGLFAPSTNQSDTLDIKNTQGTTTFSASTVDTSGPIFSVATSTGANYLTITAIGNVGVGTTSPVGKITVLTSASSTPNLILDDTANGGCIINKDSTGGTYTEIYTQSGIVLSKATTNITTCN